jgi:hypothetical protein
LPPWCARSPFGRRLHREVGEGLSSLSAIAHSGAQAVYTHASGNRREERDLKFEVAGKDRHEAWLCRTAVAPRLLAAVGIIENTSEIVRQRATMKTAGTREVEMREVRDL